MLDKMCDLAPVEDELIHKINGECYYSFPCNLGLLEDDFTRLSKEYLQ